MLQFLPKLASKKAILQHFTAYQQYKIKVLCNLVLKFGTEAEHLLWTILAKFQVNAAVFVGASSKKGNFTAFYSIFTA